MDCLVSDLFSNTCFHDDALTALLLELPLVLTHWLPLSLPPWGYFCPNVRPLGNL